MVVGKVGKSWRPSMAHKGFGLHLEAVRVIQGFLTSDIIMITFLERSLAVCHLYQLFTMINKTVANLKLHLSISDCLLRTYLLGWKLGPEDGFMEGI